MARQTAAAALLLALLAAPLLCSATDPPAPAPLPAVDGYPVQAAGAKKAHTVLRWIPLLADPKVRDCAALCAKALGNGSVAVTSPSIEAEVGAPAMCRVQLSKKISYIGYEDYTSTGTTPSCNYVDAFTNTAKSASAYSCACGKGPACGTLNEFKERSSDCGMWAPADKARCKCVKGCAATSATTIEFWGEKIPYMAIGTLPKRANAVVVADPAADGTVVKQAPAFLLTGACPL